MRPRCQTRTAPRGGRGQVRISRAVGRPTAPGAGERADPSADVHREAADVATVEFDLPGVAPGADVQAELADGRAQGLGAADGPGGPVEGRQQAVPGGVDVAAPVPFDLPAGEAGTLGEETGPRGGA